MRVFGAPEYARMSGSLGITGINSNIKPKPQTLYPRHLLNPNHQSLTNTEGRILPRSAVKAKQGVAS